jgi:hypothetical protein
VGRGVAGLGSDPVSGLDFRELSLKIIDDAIPVLSNIRMLIHGGGDEADILAALNDTIKALKVVVISVECSRRVEPEDI